MIRIENHLGTIEISQAYFAYLIGTAVSSCYGVAGKGCVRCFSAVIMPIRACG